MVSPSMSDFLMNVPDDQGHDVVVMMILGQDSWMFYVFWQGCPVQSSTNPENPILEERIQFHDRTASLDLFTFLQSPKLLMEGVTLAELNDHSFCSSDVFDSQMGSFQGRLSISACGFQLS